MQSATITALFRYPLKGFSAERLKSVNLSAGQEVPYDRAFAIENGPSGFNPETPVALPKVRFLMLMRNERIARFQSHFDETTGVLTVSEKDRVCVSGSLYDQQDVRKIEDWIQEEFAGDLRGPPRILRADGHTFSDVGTKVLHLINLASVRALQEKLGKPLDPMRFRANVLIDNVPPFAELDWQGSLMSTGETRFSVVARTQRCAATNVDPATGVRDMQIPRSLMGLFGHSDFGIYLKVERSGRIAAGDQLVTGDESEPDMPFT